ncbi:DUF1931 domain-containing protein [Candidatus Woesearchaeota archaeon]|nr:DUF1931 domain-containing protein [Candidatus Woesearchaeota archaeon]
MFVIKSNIKEAAGDICVGCDFHEALDRKVEQIIKDAAQRAKLNGRRTVMARDL